MLEAQQAEILLGIFETLYSHIERDDFYQAVLERAVESFQCEAGTIFTADPKTATLIPVASVGTPLSTLKNLPFKFGLGICGRVVEEGTSLMNNDPDEIRQLSGLYDKLTGFDTRSILCVALPSAKETLGVMELLNRMDRPFRSGDQVLLEMIAKHLATVFENRTLAHQVKHLSAFNSSILNCLPGGFVAVDKQGVITICNQKAMEMLSLSENGVVGETLGTSFKKHPVFLTIFQLLMQEQKLIVREEVEISKGGQTLRLGYSTVLMRADSGELVGYGIVFQDITKFKR